MVLDKLTNSEMYNSLNPSFKAVFEKLKTLDPKDGEIEFVIDEGNVFAHTSVVEQASTAKRQFEAHKKFIDIHFILQGEEQFVYANLSELTAVTEYDDADDCFMLEGKGSTLTLKAGDFLIAYPEDAHIPTLVKTSSDNIVRGVVKIRI